MPRVETQASSPLAPYAVSKMAAEQYCRVAHKVYGLETVCLRYFNVFGPRQDPNSQYSAVIPKFITAMLEGRAPLVHGDGEQSRDFTYVADVVAGNLLAMEAPAAPGRVVNVACGERHTLNHLVDTINDVLGTDIAPEYGPPRPGDVLHSHADISLAGELLGYAPTIPLREGIERAAETYAGAAREATTHP
jgi:UDP-glucose 4-epimerase